MNTAVSLGDLESLRQESNAQTDGQAGPAQIAVLQAFARFEVRDRSQDAREGRVVKIDFALSSDSGGGDGGVEVVEGQPENQHGVRGTAKRDRPQPERSQSPQDYCFSKDWDIHEAVTYFTMYTYNFCWLVRTLRQPASDGRWTPRTPAMAAGLTDHVWPLWEWLTLPAVQRT